jgi:GAF domain
MMGVPLVAGGRVIGVLHVGSLDRREFTSQDTELLQMAADRAAVAVQSMMAAPARTASSLPMTSIVADRLCGSIPITTALMRTSTDSPATFRRGRATLLRAARRLAPCRHRGLAFRRRASQLTAQYGPAFIHVVLAGLGSSGSPAARLSYLCRAGAGELAGEHPSAKFWAIVSCWRAKLEHLSAPPGRPGACDP